MRTLRQLEKPEDRKVFKVVCGGRIYFADSTMVVGDGDVVRAVKIHTDDGDQLALDLTAEGQRKLLDATSSRAKKFLLILIDDEVAACPHVASPIGKVLFFADAAVIEKVVARHPGA